MSPQRDTTITRQALEQHMENEDNQWILESPMITSKMESPSTSTITNTDIWQRNTEQRRKNERPEHALNVTRKNISLEIAKESK